MIITARLDEATVKQLLAELLPARVLLDADETATDEPPAPRESHRWIQIEPARQVDFVAGEGLRVETYGQLRWSAAGVPLTMTFTSAQLMLRPEVLSDDGGDGAGGGRLVFRPALEALDLKHVPGFVDTGILARVNKRLAAQGDALAWHFGQTLALRVPLPPTLLPLDKFHIAATAGTVQVLEDAIVLSVTFAMGFTRQRAT